MVSRRSKSKQKGKTSGGGTMSNMRGGFKSILGGGTKKKESLLSKIFGYLILAAAIAVLIYRFSR
ncbi:MAG: hypothetical protein V1754_01355 [Pseudomonadota bacterium]